MEMEMEPVKIILSALVVLAFFAVLVLTIKSHARLRKRRADTRGKKLYRWLIVCASVSGILWGLSLNTALFMFLAVLVERLIVYRSCFGNRTRLGRLLTRVNW
jgi:amino acid transporter